MSELQFGELLLATLRLSTPLVFAAMGGLLAERSGVATICLEGVMLTAAWVAAAVNYYTQDAALALAAAMVAGAATMAVHAFLSVTARADQIVSAVAVNLFVAGLTPFLSKWLFGSPTNTPSIPAEARLGHWFGVSPLVYGSLCLPFVLHFFMNRTVPGLKLIAAGDGPEALRAAGIPPGKVRYAALVAGGAIMALGGAFLSIAHSSQFTRDMTAGRGYIALTAVIFGKWKPIPTLLACLFFGLADASQIRLQSEPIFGVMFPVQFIQALPYIVTLLVLVGFVGQARPPRAISEKDLR